MKPQGYLLRDGLPLAVYGGGTSGPQLVFQHGLCGDARQIGEAMAGLGDQRWQALECRGHGASALDMSALATEISIATFADDVAALIERLSGPVVLGGISMGAAIACRIAVLRPDLVRGLVLVRPAWVTDHAPANMAPNAEVGRLLSTQTAASARVAFTASATAHNLAQTAPDNLASLMGFFDREPQAATAKLLMSISADGPGITQANLRALCLPTLICGTALDAIHPLAHAQALAALIPQSQFVELPPKGIDKAAHLAALAAAMTQFLKEIP